MNRIFKLLFCHTYLIYFTGVQATPLHLQVSWSTCFEPLNGPPNETTTDPLLHCNVTNVFHKQYIFWIWLFKMKGMVVSEKSLARHPVNRWRTSLEVRVWPSLLPNFVNFVCNDTIKELQDEMKDILCKKTVLFLVKKSFLSIQLYKNKIRITWLYGPFNMNWFLMIYSVTSASLNIFMCTF